MVCLVPPSGAAFLRVTGSKRTLGNTAGLGEALLPYKEAGRDLGWLQGRPGPSHLEVEAAARPEPGTSSVPGQGIAYTHHRFLSLCFLTLISGV